MGEHVGVSWFRYNRLDCILLYPIKTPCFKKMRPSVAPWRGSQSCSQIVPIFSSRRGQPIPA